ncbi:MAG: Maf family nucleotide pyrophosphatase [Lentimicrobiaceae bacterium]|nr:Maf family nucleotide pyrophosphatase [Lentimicrobiaceae bacterium]
MKHPYSFPYHIILASNSPRRQMLLKEAGINFEVRVIPTGETYPDYLERDKVSMYIAAKKAEAFSFDDLPENSLIITADTMVWLGAKSIGKPKDGAEAMAMLQQLSGNTHLVSTGVCLKTRDKVRIFNVETAVTFRTLTSEEIVFYVNTYKPFDKAGAYGIQEWIGFIGVEKIMGSYTNVIGLPVQKLYMELKRFCEP